MKNENKKNEFKFRAPTPVIYFDYMEHRRWLNRTIEEIYEKSEELRMGVKNGINYMWDNSHFKITNISGKPILSVGFFKDEISFWNDKTGDGLFSINGKVSKEDIERIDEANPFIGSGTTAAVAKRLNRNYIGIELNPNYIPLINERLKSIQKVLV